MKLMGTLLLIQGGVFVAVSPLVEEAVLLRGAAGLSFLFGIGAIALAHWFKRFDRPII